MKIVIIRAETKANTRGRYLNLISGISVGTVLN